MDYQALILGIIVFGVFLALTRFAGISFHTKAGELKQASCELRKQRHKMISERHLRNGNGNYVHGDPVWGERSE